MNPFVRHAHVIAGAALLGLCVLPSSAEAGSGLKRSAQAQAAGSLGLALPAGQNALKFGDTLQVTVANPERLAKFGVTASKNDMLTLVVSGQDEFQLQQARSQTTHTFRISREGVVTPK